MTAAAASPSPPTVSDDAVGEARTRLARPGVVVESRSMWPSALANLGLDLKGRIGDGAEPGRAVARLTDLGHGQTLRELFGGEPHDSAVPDVARARGDRGAPGLATRRSRASSWSSRRPDRR